MYDNKGLIDALAERSDKQAMKDDITGIMVIMCDLVDHPHSGVSSIAERIHLDENWVSNALVWMKQRDLVKSQRRSIPRMESPEGLTIVSESWRLA